MTSRNLAFNSPRDDAPIAQLTASILLARVQWTGGAVGVLGGRENLCERARFTGYTLDGGYAREMLVDERSCFALEGELDDAHLAPHLCAGLIGYRSLRLADAERVGLHGFGAAAHIIAQVVLQQGRRVYAFVRPGDSQARRFAESYVGHFARHGPFRHARCFGYRPCKPYRH